MKLDYWQSFNYTTAIKVELTQSVRVGSEGKSIYGFVLIVSTSNVHMFSCEQVARQEGEWKVYNNNLYLALSSCIIQ